MLWWLDNGEKLEDLEKLAASGRKIKTLERKPELYADLQDIWQAFLDLSSSRQIGLDSNPIAISEIKAWLDLHGIEDISVRIEYFRLLKIMDMKRQSWLRKKQCPTKDKKQV